MLVVSATTCSFSFFILSFAFFFSSMAFILWISTLEAILGEYSCALVSSFGALCSHEVIVFVSNSATWNPIEWDTRRWSGILIIQIVHNWFLNFFTLPVLIATLFTKYESLKSITVPSIKSASVISIRRL
ncbi:hypothetical protein RJT34_12388 [Clitoria ternatea]|uniref:Uncharacterized protein n=1 Tax=Clitoria ternatea TaxID=43366 RepID=A0AAN9JPE9_CLITE